MESITLYLLYITYFIHPVYLSNLIETPNMKISALNNSPSVSPITIKRKFVKLTMKQGLLMNQVLNTYAIDQVENHLCKNHTEEFKQAFRAFEPWALKMFDSSSKLQAGILIGNLMEFGSYQQCLEINQVTNVGQIQGKYCSIKIIPPLSLIKKILNYRNITERRFPKVRIIVERAMLRWSVCVPKSCPVDVIHRHFNKTIQDLGEGLNLEVSLKNRDCITVDDGPKLGSTQIISLTVLGIFVFLALVSTLIDWKNSEDRNKFVDIFSISGNFQLIMSKGKPSDLDCIHGLRFLSTMYVIIGHRYLMNMFFPVANGLEILDWTLNYSSTIIIGGTVCVDSFFMISGLLVAYGFFNHVTNTNNFSLLRFYIYRYFRLTPSLGIVVIFYATLLQFFGSGPLWLDTVAAQQLPCQYFWWSTLLHLQSYINPGALCITQAWYLSCEMPFYYASPLILYPLWKWSLFGKINYGLFYILSVATSFYLAWINEYQGGMPITNQLLITEYFTKHYITPHTRAPPYIMGLGLGYLLFKTRNMKIQINLLMNICGWLIAFTLMISAIVGCHGFQEENHDYNRLEASMFLALSRSAWTLGIVWIAWICVKGYGGIVNTFLSLHLFRVLGRISYGMFLLHMIFQFLKCGALKVPIYFSNFTTIYETAADWSLVIVIGFFFTIFYELPLVKLQACFFNFKASKKVVNVK